MCVHFVTSKHEKILNKFAKVLPDWDFSFMINRKTQEGNNLLEWVLCTRNPSQSITYDALKMDSN